MKTTLLLVIPFFSFLALVVNAAEPFAPTTSLEPEQVLAIQLEALQHNDRPYADAGIAQIWAFAHPANRMYTGPLSRFMAMLKAPAYRGLLGHHRHSIELMRREERSATFLVTVQTGDSRALGYKWTVEKVEDGEFAGCWMTSGVSRAAQLGDVI